MLIDWFYMQWSSRSTNQIEVENLIRTFSRNLKGNQRLNTLILQAHVNFYLQKYRIRSRKSQRKRKQL